MMGMGSPHGLEETEQSRCVRSTVKWRNSKRMFHQRKWPTLPVGNPKPPGGVASPTVNTQLLKVIIYNSLCHINVVAACWW